ncbi:MAG: hypothetical protein R3F30_00500 [Planctomycetota bacterium]
MLGDIDGSGSLEFVTHCRRPELATASTYGIITCSLDALDLGVDVEEVSLFHGGKQELRGPRRDQRAGSLVLMLGTASS